jgi:hypothetical protein
MCLKIYTKKLPNLRQGAFIFRKKPYFANYLLASSIATATATCHYE